MEAKMTDHQALPVQGYKPQSQGAVDQVNLNKTMEEEILRRLDAMKAWTDIDQRWLAIGRTHIEQGFMAMNRAIFMPGRAKLSSDP
jgi:hypothetical protein